MDNPSNRIFVAPTQKTIFKSQIEIGFELGGSIFARSNFLLSQNITTSTSHKKKNR